MSAEVHIFDEVACKDTPYTLYCRVVFYAHPRAVGVRRVHEATCPACIEAYETQPLPVTTKDLLPIVQALRTVTAELLWLGDRRRLLPVFNQIDELAQKLERPRKVKQQP